MFDIAFSELAVIAGVALIVIGPEKLPKVARTAGTIMGRFQRYAAQIREEVNREARFEDLQKLQQEIKTGVEQGVARVNEQISNTIAPDVKAVAPKTRKPRSKPKTQEIPAIPKSTAAKKTNSNSIKRNPPAKATRKPGTTKAKPSKTK